MPEPGLRTHTFALASIRLGLALLVLLPLGTLQAQRGTESPPDAGTLTVERIFSADFRSAPMPSLVWMQDGRSYLDVRSDPQGGSNIVRVDLVSGNVTTMAAASSLVDASGDRITVEAIELSGDERKALLFSNSVRVWRANTRGMYHVYDFATRKVTPIVRSTTPAPDSNEFEPDPSLAVPSFIVDEVRDPDLQMFAKFSPDARKVAYVRANDLWVTDLESGEELRITTDGSPNIINGTTDWVYEEELGLRDAFRWSPDSRRIAWWRFDQSAVPEFALVNELGQYPSVEVLRYPKAGEQNSSVRVGVADLATRGTTWLQVGPDTGQYVARMEWLGTDSIVVQRMPRKQDRVDIMLLSASTGQGRVVASDSDRAYVNVQNITWLEDGRQFLLLSDRTGWRQLFLYGRDGEVVRQLTRDGSDVLSVSGVDETRGFVYVTVAAPDPTQRQLYRVSLDGGARPERITTEKGTHNVSIGPDSRYLVDFHSTIERPATAVLYELPAMRSVRVLQDNAALQRTVSALNVKAPEFFRIPMPDGTRLDAYRVVPPDFNPRTRYPVLMYVYGGPASPTVSDAWGGSRYLWHQLLAQQGYVVVSVDNRGAAWRGRDFRKATQLKLGMAESQDQVDAAKWLARQGWVHGSRIGIWGWSYGGYMTAMTTARGGDVFRMGISVAPVTDWRLYDTIYTERFMWLPRLNEEGYRQTSVMTHLAGLRAELLLVHGTGDDNVHSQNTLILADSLVQLGRPFSMLMYPNRTHSISGGNSSIHLYNQMTRFVKEKL
ncbi:MAG TPA: S9 family peptidase [Gemmatimonadales bacterium]|nr:S9 family peptidase [Gemmatimonadales bacterium]